ncbi:MAG: hypothetical protein EOO77_47750 [Oxalobacteraceae bacterium]|nr:MAG: hypothetical protein EOO77_47750 [Oxalobacteraceae bacterium]
MPPLPRNCSDHGSDVTVVAKIFVTHNEAKAEALIATLIAEALERWLLDDATFWSGFDKERITALAQE